jgi:F420H(2)-dependent quinone reductase
MSQAAPVGPPAVRRPGAFKRWVFRALDTVHAFLYRRGIGRTMGRMQQLLLTTTGRVSGRPYTVALSTVREGDGWVVIGSFGGADVHPGWWLNLVARPEALIQVNDQVVKVLMEEITNPADRDRIWSAVVAIAPNYAGYARKTSRVIPLGLLRPIV